MNTLEPFTLRINQFKLIDLVYSKFNFDWVLYFIVVYPL